MDRVQKKREKKKPKQNDNNLFFLKKKWVEIENRRRIVCVGQWEISFLPLSRGVESKDGRPLEIEWRGLRGVRRG